MESLQIYLYTCGRYVAMKYFNRLPNNLKVLSCNTKAIERRRFGLSYVKSIL